MKEKMIIVYDSCRNWDSFRHKYTKHANIKMLIQDHETSANGPTEDSLITRLLDAKDPSNLCVFIHFSDVEQGRWTDVFRAILKTSGTVVVYSGGEGVNQERDDFFKKNPRNAENVEWFSGVDHSANPRDRFRRIIDKWIFGAVLDVRSLTAFRVLFDVALYLKSPNLHVFRHIPADIEAGTESLLSKSFWAPVRGFMGGIAKENLDVLHVENEHKLLLACLWHMNEQLEQDQYGPNIREDCVQKYLSRLGQ